MLATAAVLATLLAACTVSAPAQAEQPPNTDPRVGWVVVAQEYPAPDNGYAYVNITKRCDDTTLMYLSTGNRNTASSIDVYPNSPECTPR